MYIDPSPRPPKPKNNPTPCTLFLKDIHVGSISKLAEKTEKIISEEIITCMKYAQV
jgi:hypothetical protein